MTASNFAAQLLFKIIFFFARLKMSLSVTPSDAERFPSSIVVTTDELLIGLQRFPQHQCTQTERRRGIDIARSRIDRDSIYLEGEDNYSDSLENNLHTSIEHGPLSHFYNRHPSDQWQSPLERISPLPSSTINSNSQLESPEILTGSPIIINFGPKHSHQIDVRRRHHKNSFEVNQQQQQSQYTLKTRSTGTTIAALLANNSTVLVLAADTRATDDSTVADKRCEKLHTLAKNVWCAGAGTSADVEAMVRRVKFTFWKRGVLNGYNVGIGNMGRIGRNNIGGLGVGTQLLSTEDNDVPTASVMAILHYLRTELQKTRGALGVNLLVGGYEYNLHRAYLAAVKPHGSMDVVTHAALGSGGLAATGILESRYPKIGSSRCTVEDGIRLAVDAVKAGIDNDLGSGSQVDVCVISSEGVLYRRAIVKEEELEWINENDCWYDSLRNVKESDHLVASGVNGFGNLPFSVQSKKIVVGGRIDAERERRRWLDGVLRAEKD